jgi:hypothetical protein
VWGWLWLATKLGAANQQRTSGVTTRHAADRNAGF